jgi:hypothetical protein
LNKFDSEIALASSTFAIVAMPRTQSEVWTATDSAENESASKCQTVAAAVVVDAVVVVADPVLGRARLAVVEDAVRAKRPIERATLWRSKTSPPGSAGQT